MDDYISRLRNGSLKLYALEKELTPGDAVSVRRKYIEGETGVHLKKIGDCSIALDAAVKKNCENMIGTVQVPLGVAGPIVIRGEYANGRYYLPLATTEGALIASVNRGCNLITGAGGADVRVFSDGMTRAPVFATDSIVHAKKVCDWISSNEDGIRNVTEATTRHGRLNGILTTTAGTSVYVRLSFLTGDAMGMNMVTIASAKAADLICQETGARLVSLSGNWCTDKKPAAINVILGRGKTVSAGVLLKHEMIEQTLKTKAELLIDVNTRKNLVGSARAGSLGWNAHAANIVAAMFIACGQDPAHVVEGSLCITTVDPAEEGVYISVTLPALPVGTVGGGTSLDTQAECLNMLRVAGGGDPPGTNAKALAEIIGAGVLAGEISLLGALAAQHLARAHVALGRG
jgi:hydroxymethylglutaryl-CoA reductase (NADPH)